MNPRMTTADHNPNTSRTLSIVTGTSRGMGAAVARQLLKPNDSILAISRNVNKVLQHEAAQTQTILEHWLADLAQVTEIEEPLEDWLGEQRQQHWDVVQLINNASVIPPITPLSRTSSADIIEGLQVGLVATMPPWYSPQRLYAPRKVGPHNAKY